MKKIIRLELNSEECRFIFDYKSIEEVIKTLTDMYLYAIKEYPEATNLELTHEYEPYSEQYYITITGDLLENDSQYSQRLSSEQYTEEKERLEYLRLKENGDENEIFNITKPVNYISWDDLRIIYQLINTKSKKLAYYIFFWSLPQYIPF